MPCTCKAQNTAPVVVWWVSRACAPPATGIQRIVRDRRERGRHYDERERAGFARTMQARQCSGFPKEAGPRYALRTTLPEALQQLKISNGDPRWSVRGGRHRTPQGLLSMVRSIVGDVFRYVSSTMVQYPPKSSPRLPTRSSQPGNSAIPSSDATNDPVRRRALEQIWIFDDGWRRTRDTARCCQGHHAREAGRTAVVLMTHDEGSQRQMDEGYPARLGGMCHLWTLRASADQHIARRVEDVYYTRS